MTEKLGVLLVDVPEPRLFKYHSLVCDREFFLDGHDEKTSTVELEIPDQSFYLEITIKTKEAENDTEN